MMENENGFKLILKQCGFDLETMGSTGLTTLIPKLMELAKSHLYRLYTVKGVISQSKINLNKFEFLYKNKFEFCCMWHLCNFIIFIWGWNKSSSGAHWNVS